MYIHDEIFKNQKNYIIIENNKVYRQVNFKVILYLMLINILIIFFTDFTILHF